MDGMGYMRQTERDAQKWVMAQLPAADAGDLAIWLGSANFSDATARIHVHGCYARDKTQTWTSDMRTQSDRSSGFCP